MKIVQINVTCNGSTGKIMCQIQNRAIAEGLEASSFYGRGTGPDPEKAKGTYTRMESPLAIYAHAFQARFFDKMGHGSGAATRRLIKELKAIQPDIVHIHNIHGYYINIKKLFKYFKESGVKVVWTLHDCWAFTGGCAYFLSCGCKKWQAGCYACPQKNTYPQSYIDKSKREYFFKKNIFTGVPGLTLTAPSDWIADLARQSFLGEYPIVPVYNGIDTDIFRPAAPEENKVTRAKLGIAQDTRMVLGVANVWDKRKRLSSFIELASAMENENVIIVVVGITEKQKQALPAGIIGITQTENTEALVKLYAAADVFVSTSVEESFALVVAEAMACGTPVVCVDGGGCRELVGDGVGKIVPRDDKASLADAVREVLAQRDAFAANCRIRCEKMYSLSAMTDGYMNVYREQYGK